MNVLAGYGSDSDDDCPAPPVPAPRPRQAPTSSQTTTATPKEVAPQKKKVKKLDISVLPIEIQNALARCDSDNSSDSELEDGVYTHSEKKPEVEGNNRIRSMLDQLPKPRQDQDRLAGKIVDVTRPNGVHATPIDPPTSALPQVTNERPQTSTLERSHTSSSSVPYDAMPTQVQQKTYSLTASAPAPSMASQPPLLNAAPASQHGSGPSIVQSNEYYAAHRERNQNAHAGSIEVGPSLPQPHFSSSFNSNNTVRPTGGKSSRKREREIQEELLRGNVTAVEEGQFIDVSGAQGWDSTKYNEQQSREAEVNGMFSRQAGDKMIAQPTKLQTRRHQINSLAMSAASVELELMEARGARAKSKAETQSKYGW